MMLWLNNSYPVYTSIPSTEYFGMDSNPSRQAVSRKRTGATRLSRLEENTTEQSSSQSLQNSAQSLSRSLSNESLSQEKRIRRDGLEGTPSQEVSRSDLFTREFSKISSCGSIIVSKPFDPLARTPLLNDQVIKNYMIIGAGKEARAVHVPSNKVFLAKVLNMKEAMNVAKVVERLNNAHDFYHASDIDELRDLVFPKCAELVKECDGRFVLFVPSEKESVHSFATERSDKITEKEVFDIFEQVVRIVSFCHHIGIIVRDMKPRKLVFHGETSGDNRKIRLESVQDCVVVADPSDDQIRERFGSPAYVPPEVLNTRQGTYSGKSADIWGMGVLMYMLLFGKYPFFDKTPAGVFKKIRRARVVFPPHNLRNSTLNLVLALLKREPNERPTALDLRFVMEKLGNPRDDLCRFGGIAQESTDNIRRRIGFESPSEEAVPSLPGLSDHLNGLISSVHESTGVPRGEVPPQEARPILDPSHDPAAPFGYEHGVPRTHASIRLIMNQLDVFHEIMSAVIDAPHSGNPTQDDINALPTLYAARAHLDAVMAVAPQSLLVRNPQTSSTPTNESRPQRPAANDSRTRMIDTSPATLERIRDAILAARRENQLAREALAQTRTAVNEAVSTVSLALRSRRILPLPEEARQRILAEIRRASAAQQARPSNTDVNEVAAVAEHPLLPPDMAVFANQEASLRERLRGNFEDARTDQNSETPDNQ